MKPFSSVILFTLFCATSSISFAQTSSLKFNGVNTYVQLDTVLPIGNTSSTVEMWVSVPFPGTEGLGTTQRVGILLGNFNDPPNAGWEIHNQGDLRFWWNGGEIDIRGTTTDLRDNTWHHIAIVRDKEEGEEGKIFGYIDGNLEFTNNTAGSDIHFTTMHRLGADNRGSGTPYFNGEIDEVRIWNIARTQEEIQQNLLKPLNGDEAGLIVYYKMSDNSGSVLSDNSTNAPTINGTLNGGISWTTDHLIPLGNGSEGIPYEIATLNNLYWLADNNSLWSSGTHFRQVNNIDASTTGMWDGEKGFSPIGIFSTNPFEGKYDGNGHIIDQLTISRSDQQYIGLFGYLKNAHIQNIGVKNSSLTGSNFVGGLAGRSDNSTIEKSFTSGEISGNNFLGGLIASSMNSSIYNSYSTVNINGNERGGGLVGDMDSSSIINSYAACNIDDEMLFSGGLVGTSSGSTVENSFWDISASAQLTSAEGEGKTSEEMKDVYTFLDAGWDFVVEAANGTEDVWDMDLINEGINSGYPILSWQTSGNNLRKFEAVLNHNEGWRLLSTPAIISYQRLLNSVWTQGADYGANTTSGTPNIYTWPDRPGKDPIDWVSVTDLRNKIPEGSGFLAYIYADDNFDGIDDPFPKRLTVYGIDDAQEISAAINTNTSAFSLIGNPYPATIAFDDVSKTGLTNVAYVWDPNDDSGDGGTEANSPGGSWKTWNGSVGDLTGGLIAPFQGFFVQNSEMSTRSLTFTESSISEVPGSFYGKTVHHDVMAARIHLEGEGLRSSVWLQFSENGSSSKQVLGDALKLESFGNDYARIAIQKNDVLLDIAHLPSVAEYLTIPLDISATKAGNFTIDFTDKILTDAFSIYLYDHELDHLEKAKLGFKYSFNLRSASARKNLSPNSIPGLLLAEKSKEIRFSLLIHSEGEFDSDRFNVLPNRVSLHQNYPNPFNPTTSIRYSLPAATNVTLVVYDMIGRKVADLVKGFYQPGEYIVPFDAANLSSGVYMYQLTAGQVSITKKMTVVK